MRRRVLAASDPRNRLSCVTRKQCHPMRQTGGGGGGRRRVVMRAILSSADWPLSVPSFSTFLQGVVTSRASHSNRRFTQMKSNPARSLKFCLLKISALSHLPVTVTVSLVFLSSFFSPNVKFNCYCILQLQLCY